jgi:O-acetyl-ADP-ribose deacetylase (regulator of RNase III)
MESNITILRGDITEQEVDAIVNAANTSLLGGGGVDGAIHAAAGPLLLKECRTLGGCPTGDAKITKGYKLPARWVIHTVGPVWRAGARDEDELLAKCYRNSLRLAHEHGVQAIAFPSISTGAYGFPVERAAGIALKEIGRFLASHDLPAEVRMVCFDKTTYEVYLRALGSMKRSAAGSGDPRED